MRCFVYDSARNNAGQSVSGAFPGRVERVTCRFMLLYQGLTLTTSATCNCVVGGGAICDDILLWRSVAFKFVSPEKTRNFLITDTTLKKQKNYSRYLSFLSLTGTAHTTFLGCRAGPRSVSVRSEASYQAFEVVSSLWRDGKMCSAFV